MPAFDEILPFDDLATGNDGDVIDDGTFTLAGDNQLLHTIVITLPAMRETILTEREFTMASSVPTNGIDPTTYHGDQPSSHNAAQQQGTFPGPDRDEYSVPGAYAEGQAAEGEQHVSNPTMPGSPSAPGQPSGSIGSGSTGIVGEIING